MSKHEWRDRAEDDELRFVRATLHGRVWKFEARLKSEDDWTVLDPIPLEDLEALRDVLWRKYKRGRVPHGQVLQIDQLIEARGAPP